MNYQSNSLSEKVDPIRIVTGYMGASPGLWLVSVVLAVLGLFTSNPGLTFSAMLILPVLNLLLWRKGEPPALFFAVFFQWLQVSTKVFHADMLGISVEEMFKGWSITDAIWLSLTGLLAISIGIRIGKLGMEGTNLSTIEKEVKYAPIDRVFWAYVFSYLVAIALKTLMWVVPSFSQIFLALSNIKWVMFFVLAYHVLIRKEKYSYLGLASALELVIGFTGYFAEFKQVFFVLGIAYLTTKITLSKESLVRILVLGVLVVFLGICWVSVKIEYRDYINGGTGDQVVVVPLIDRLGKIVDLFTSLELKEIQNGVEDLAKRIAYVDYFAHVLDMVPANLPFDNGKQWYKGLAHVLQPRFLFPDKPKLESDTELTIKYTGVVFRETQRATSISIGYMAQSYIDFGRTWMFVPILMFGILLGVMYRTLIAQSGGSIYGYGTVVAVFVYANQYETHIAKILGGSIMSFAMALVLIKWVLPRVKTWVQNSQ